MPSIFQKSLPTVMQHSFSRVPQARIPRSQFKRNFAHKTTFSADYIVPMYWDEVYPSDTGQMRFTSICRFLAPPEKPFMDNLYLDTFFFYVPTRLLQTNFVKLWGERINPGDSIDYATPKLAPPGAGGLVPPTDWSAPTATQLSAALYDYFGYPTKVNWAVGDSPHNYLGRAYNLIYNTWFRDQNLQTAVVVDLDDGTDAFTDYKLLKRGKRHDYFTSCLPWLQQGTAQSLPLGTSAPVLGIGKQNQVFNLTNVTAYESDNTTSVYPFGTSINGGATNENFYVKGSAAAGGYPQITTDLTAATAATVGSLYQALAIQDLLMADLRGGSRYVELVNSHFGVTVPDYRAQRPEYLGGTSVPFMVSPIANTAETGSIQLGVLGATAAASFDGTGFFKSFVEHGWVIGLMSVRADLTYQYGMHRSLSRSTRYDFYIPSLANLIEQPVYVKEIWMDGTANDAAVFAYQERWSELRYGRSQITGRLRSNDAATLDVYHLAEKFTAAPAFNATFIQQNTPIARIATVTTEPHFVIDVFGEGNWARPMPLYSVPGIMNRF